MNKNLFDEIMLVSPVSLSTLKKTPDDRSKVLLRLFEIPVIGRTLYYILTNRSNTEYYLTEKCFFNSFHMEPSIVKAYYDGAHAGNGNGKYLMASLQSNYLYADVTRALKAAENRIIVTVGIQNNDAEDIVNGYLSLNPNITLERIDQAKLLPQLEPEATGEMLELMYIF